VELSSVTAKRIVPVVVIHDTERAAPLAEALLAGGLDVIEITFRTPASEAAVTSIVRAFPEMIVGAGTLLTPAQVARALAAGAQFGVAPGLNPAVLAAAREVGLPFVPGVMTPTEVEGALAEGCTTLKFFPASLAGGVEMLQALAGPYGQAGAKFIALGGITPANMAEYLRLPVVAAVGGSWIVEPRLVAAGDWTEITRRTQEAREIVASVQHPAKA
jgi:2-dehydro-3-deoxyphosphogluconate aldolase/(4S)-4-hydroxy-2-oxoglutarate aldolase